MEAATLTTRTTQRVSRTRWRGAPVRRAASLAAWALAGLLCAGLLLVPSSAPAQSILSAPLPVEDGTPAGSRALVAADSRPLESLFRAVDEGQGATVYEALEERMVAELALAAAEGRDLDALRRRYLIHLLRAGETAAPPAKQEARARQFTRNYPDDEQFPLAFFYLNEAQFRQGKPLEDSFFFDAAALGSLAPWAQSRYLRMRAEDAGGRGDYLAAAGYLLDELERPGTLQRSTPHEVELWLERVDDPTALRDFLDAHASVEWLEERRPLLTARVLMNAERMEAALLVLERLQAGDALLPTETVRAINDLKSELRERVQVYPQRIGVLLPLGSSSGFLRALANEALDGVRLAVQFPEGRPAGEGRLERLLGQDLQRPDETAKAPGPPAVELVVRDTGNDPQQAARMVERLVREDRVVAIVGPLARAESSAAAERAEALGVPLISFSVSLDIDAGARYVFRHNLSQEAEVRDLVRYAMDYLHARRFALLYPDTGYGRTMMSLFWQEAEGRGGKVVAASAFTPSRQRGAPGREAVGFKEIFASFTGLDRYVAPEDRKLMEAVGDSDPDPIVDFDALFIPTGPAGLADLQLVAPYPVTVDAEHVLFLGSRFWNDDAVIVAGDGKLDGAVFVDTYDRTATNPRVATFLQRHRAFFGHRGGYRTPSFYTGLGYDTVNLLAGLLADPAHRSREDLAAGLRTMEPVFGVTGMTRFKPDGASEKQSMFFRLVDNEIVRLRP